MPLPECILSPYRELVFDVASLDLCLAPTVCVGGTRPQTTPTHSTDTQGTTYRTKAVRCLCHWEAHMRNRILRRGPHCWSTYTTAPQLLAQLLHTWKVVP